MSQVRYQVRGVIAALVLLSGSIVAGQAGAQTAAKSGGTPPTPKVSAKQAAAAAVKKIGGKALSTKYEFEDNRWQYAVIVKNKAGQMYEVEVNSTTAAIIATEKTSPAEEAKEAAADKKKAAGAKVEEKDEKNEKGEKPD